MTRQPPSVDRDTGIDRDLAVLMENLTARLQAGERVDENELLAVHPEHADRLRQLLPALRLLADAGPASQRLTIEDPFSVAGLFEAGPDPIGDFRIIREVGRGGMGIVYEAIQLSLNRRVALKVLPFAATMDPRQLQRFRHEAQAAALLHHPNIVPVYGVGCERGVHYYAMQLIEGRSLAAVIETQRDEGRGTRDEPRPATASFDSSLIPHSSSLPTAPVAALSTQKTRRDKAHYRRLAELIAQAADALEYAHSMGVVHRDIKPGNLMLDEDGHLWVTDFGLAKLETAVELTMSGDLLGTLRYMSPEQALARHGLVDHRTDVYSLGATFYELLTLRPAVDGADKAEMLKKIAFEEPTALRKIDKAIPAELETIALKCLAKNPNERYATAGELVEDLRRFLDDTPINAKPPGLRDRTAKWARRHRGFVAASFVILAVALVASCVSTFVIWQKEEMVHVAYQDAASDRDRAQANLRVARAAIEQVTARLGDRLTNAPGMEKVRVEVLQEAHRFFQILLQDHSSDAELRFEMASNAASLGTLLRDLGRKEDSEAALRDGVRMFAELASEFPVEPEYRHRLAAIRNELGTCLGRAGRRTEAEETYRQAIEIQEILVRENPRDAHSRTFLSNMHCNRGILLCDMNQLAPAEAALHRSIALREELIREFPNDPVHQHGLSAAQYGLALVFNKLGRYSEVEQAFQAVVAGRESLVAGWPENFDYRFALAHSLNQQAAFFQKMGRLPEAEAALKKAVPHLRKCAADFPSMPLARRELGRSLNDLGEVQATSKRPAEARESYGQALAVWESLARSFRQDPVYRTNLARTKSDLAWLLATCPDPIVRDVRQALQLAQQAVASMPSESAFHSTLGVANYRAGDWKAAVAELEKSVEISKGGEATDWFFLAMAHWQLGNREQSRKYYTQAVDWMEKNQPKGDELRRFRAEAAELLGISFNETDRAGTRP